MNLREKLGQCFVFRLPDVTELTPRVANFLTECRAGGLILFGFNVKRPNQVRRLNRDLQNLAKEKGLPPLLISVDEEGGQVSRQPAKGQELIAPSQMAQAQGGVESVRACAAVTARRLRYFGFNLDYTPVVDINNNMRNPVIGLRSFGETAETVAEMGVAAIEAYLQGGISPCAKHFPGHGDTAVDSHFGLPFVNKSLEELKAFELVPFQRAVEAGVPAIMSAHIVYPQVDKSGLPATLSPIFLTRLLRQEMGYEGLIFTDALNMRAIADKWGLGKAAVMAFQAGADLVMPIGMLDEQLAAFEEVLATIERGDLDLSRLDASVARIEKWKNRFCLPLSDEANPQEDYTALANAAKKGIKLIPGNVKLLPLTPTNAQRPLLIDFTVPMGSPVEEGRQPGPLLEESLRESLPNLLRVEVAVNPDEKESGRVLAWAEQSDLLLIVARRAVQNPLQAKLVNTLLANQTKSVLVIAREPYDLELFPPTCTAILTYGDPPVSIQALVQALI
jgi:beta-N-acetylhexosaminidase